jgi:hypothetical protein
MQFDNPPIAPQLRAHLLLICLALLAAGVGLFFVSHETRDVWPWDVEPFNMLFLGAVHLASLGTVGLLFWYARWSPARLVLPMLFVFATSVLLVSLLHFGRFDFSRWTAWGWFVLYASVAINAAAYLWRYRSVPPPAMHPTPLPWRVMLVGLTAGLGLYGTAMFAAPGALTAFWPWPVDDFHGRLYSAVFTTAAVGALGLALVAAPVERLTLGVAYSILGLFAIFSVAIADARQGSINPAEPGTWAWFGLFGVLFAAGLLMVWWSSLAEEATA